MRGSHRLTMVRIQTVQVQMVQDSDGPELNQFKDSHGSKKTQEFEPEASGTSLKTS